MSRRVPVTENDPALDDLVRRTNRTLGLAALSLVAAFVALLTIAAMAGVVDDARHFAAGDECDVATYVEHNGPSDPVPEQVRFVDRTWVPPEVHCEARFPGASQPTRRVDYSYWYALAALVPLVCLLSLTVRGVLRLSKTRSRQTS